MRRLSHGSTYVYDIFPKIKKKIDEITNQESINLSHQHRKEEDNNDKEKCPDQKQNDNETFPARTPCTTKLTMILENQFPKRYCLNSHHVLRFLTITQLSRINELDDMKFFLQ